MRMGDPFMSRKQPTPPPYTLNEDGSPVIVARPAPPPAPPKRKCPYCGGMGFVEADIGQLFECTPCNTSGEAND